MGNAGHSLYGKTGISGGHPEDHAPFVNITQQTLQNTIFAVLLESGIFL
jgi:hypothetical protein